MADQSDSSVSKGEGVNSNNEPSSYNPSHVSTTSSEHADAGTSSSGGQPAQGSFWSAGRLGAGMGNPFSFGRSGPSSGSILAPSKFGTAVGSGSEPNPPQPSNGQDSQPQSLLDFQGQRVRNPFISPPRLLVASGESRQGDGDVNSTTTKSANNSDSPKSNGTLKPEDPTSSPIRDVGDTGDRSADNMAGPSSTEVTTTSADSEIHSPPSNSKASEVSSSSTPEAVVNHDVDAGQAQGGANPQDSQPTPAPVKGVFGQMICDKVMGAEAAPSVAEEGAGSSKASLFRDYAAQTEAAGPSIGGGAGGESSQSGQPPQSIAEAADAYERKKASGPLLPEVAVTTGEENERNALQIFCKLFYFAKADSKWIERGRGQLRLNDLCEGGGGGGGESSSAQSIHSRLIVRTAGVRRVILNTNIWADMLCEVVAPKSLRITGMEDNAVRVFLINGAPKDVDHLHNAITYRIQTLRTSEANAGGGLTGGDDPSTPTSATPATSASSSSTAAALPSSETSEGECVTMESSHHDMAAGSDCSSEVMTSSSSPSSRAQEQGEGSSGGSEGAPRGSASGGKRKSDSPCQMDSEQERDSPPDGDSPPDSKRLRK